jgi:integrase
MKLIEFLTYEEASKLIKAARTKELKLAIALGFGSGLRLSEVVGGISKVSKRKIPALVQNMVNLKEHQIRILSGKGDKDRITVTSPWLNESNIKNLPIILPQRTLQYQFTALCKRVLSKKAHFHQLRHGFGNYMVNEKGIPMPMVQAMMGHSRIDTTGIYAKANPKEAVKRAWESF